MMRLGYTRGADGIRFKTEVKIHERTDLGYGELVVEYFRDIGIDLEFEILPVAEHGAKIGRRPLTLFSGRVQPRALRISQWISFPTTAAQSGVLNFRKHDPDYERIIGDMRAATTLEEWTRFFREADDYVIEKHWLIWGPGVPPGQVVQPWITGWNGENMDTNIDVFARLWIDSELKAAMGY